MLKVFREQTKSLHWVLWLIIASFIILIFVQWGGAGSGVQGASTWVSKIGDDEIDTATFSSYLQDEEFRLRQAFGDQYQQSMLDLDGVLERLHNRALLRQQAERLGLTPSTAEVAQQVKDIPAFQTNGVFDRQAYDDFLNSRGTSHADFEAERAADVQINRMRDLLLSSISVSDSALEEEWRRRNETVTIDYVLFEPGHYDANVQLTDQEVREWYDDHRDDYDEGEGRRIQVLDFDPRKIQQELAVDADVQAYYQENLDAIYTMPADQRRASRILVEVPQGANEALRELLRGEAEEIAARVRAGEDFAEIARAESDDKETRLEGGDMGPFFQDTHEESLDVEFFQMEEGEIRGPIETTRGYDIILLTKGEGRKAKPLSEVRSRILNALYSDSASAEANRRMDAFFAAYADNPDFDAAAKTASLSLDDSRWVTRQDVLSSDLSPSIVNQAFNLDIGEKSDPVPTASGQAIVKVLETRETSPQPFDEVEDRVRQDARRDRGALLARSRAEEIREIAAETPDDLSEVAAMVADEGPSVQSSGKIRQGGFVSGFGIAQDLNDAAFGTEQGQIGPVVDTDRGSVLFRVKEREEFDPERFATEKGTLSATIRNQSYRLLLDSTLSKMRDANQDQVENNDVLLSGYRQALAGSASQTAPAPVGQ
ncbi:MAG: peptidyl-prolyl cis-trans isomerase [Acidobacteriota bacterium]